MTKMLTTPGIPRRSPIQVPTNRARGCLTSEIERDRVYSTWRSPIQVLTEPKVAKLPRSNEIGSTQPDMVVGDIKRKKMPFQL
ncbi:unnamed protein product [Clavelina lepadiformis]|uniref:Uncharacterized protein n=1 Tax=Clavelina lepadiformis TaxID=159417 RepID=A0ABP0G445_CLALP